VRSSGGGLPVVALIVGLGIFGVYSYLDHAYGTAKASSAPRPVISAWLPGDEGASPAKQPPDDTPSPTPLSTLTEPSSSGAMGTPIDPWISEAMEAGIREPLAEELKEPGEEEGEDLLRGASSDYAGVPEDPVPPEIGSRSFETPLSEDAIAYSRNPAQPSTDQYTDATPQQAATLAPPPDPPTGTEVLSPLPADAPSRWDVDDDAGEGNDEPKRILIVDDPRALGEALAMRLNRQPGLEVVGRTSSASGCRDFFVAGEQGFDVSVVHLFLLDAQGASLIEELRRSCPHAPVLVLIERPDPSYRERAMRAGADAVLDRSADPEEILSVVRRLSLTY
jgi:CheY-like chemotaxis protein